MTFQAVTLRKEGTLTHSSYLCARRGYSVFPLTRDLANTADKSRYTTDISVGKDVQMNVSLASA
jgi:hypothetical protein